MRQFLFCFFFLTTAVLASQSKERSLQFGPRLFVWNIKPPSDRVNSAKPVWEIMNGFFLKYSAGRFGYRLIGSYDLWGNNGGFYTGDTIGKSIANKDLILGLGFQYQLIPEQKWLYALIDLSYRHVNAKGSVTMDSSYVNIPFSSKVNGFDALTGLCISLRLFRTLRFNQEFGFNFISESTKYSPGDQPGPIYYYHNSSFHPYYRILLSFQINFKSKTPDQ